MVRLSQLTVLVSVALIAPVVVAPSVLSASETSNVDGATIHFHSHFPDVDDGAALSTNAIVVDPAKDTLVDTAAQLARALSYLLR
ncbi:hypothetical protein N9K47_00500 [bacterium]|nr:hypothetical protein [bacterium]